jgi:hypothetical protein
MLDASGGWCDSYVRGGNGDHDGYLRTFSFFSHSTVTFMA